MSRLKLLLVTFVITSAIMVGIIYWWPRAENREQEARKMIENAVRAEYLPSNYYLANGSKYAYLGFGYKYADQFYMNWRINNSYFIALFGYDKNWPYNFMGYIIKVWVKDPQESETELARMIFSSLPDNGWKQAGPEEQPYGNTSIACVLWNSGYMSVIRFKYEKPEIYRMPEEELVRDIAHVSYYSITSMNTDPVYQHLQELQDAEFQIYGGG